MANQQLVERILDFLKQPGGLTNGSRYWDRHLLVPWGVPGDEARRIRKDLLMKFPSGATDFEF
jgi:hypothetical protein